MRKALPFLGVSLSALAMALSTPALAQKDEFKDLDKNHWAYQAVVDLQQKGVLEGYPGGYFKGKRFMTRYEFAIAVRRLIDKIGGGGKGDPGEKGAPGDKGDKGDQGEKGDPGNPGISPEELDTIKRLVNEFKTELASLGTDVRAVRARLDKLSTDVADLKRTIDKMPKITGDFFFGVRSDQSRFPFLDYSGAVRGASKSLFSNVNTLNDFHLGVTGNLSGGAKFKGDLVSSNYLSYRGINLAGPPTALGPGGLAQQTTLDEAEVDVPLGGYESGSSLVVGRFKHHLTPLTFWRPDYDTYFDVPWDDDGKYVQDGIKYTGKYGSVGAMLWASSHSSPTTQSGATFSQPGFGISPAGFRGAGGAFAGKPFGIATPGSEVANQSAGLHLSTKLGHFGEVGLTLIDLNATAPSSAGKTFGNEVIYGFNLKVNDYGRFKFNAEVAKSVLQRTIDTGETSGVSNNEDNNAIVAHIGWGSGPLTIGAGYNYFDPRYSAPGYWGKIGNWYNPTNVEGGYLAVGYQITPSIKFNGQANIWSGIRGRAGWGTHDDIWQGKAALNWQTNRTLATFVEYEGVQYRLSAASSAIGTGSHPQEHYVTLGANWTLAGSTVLKLAYQIINFQDNKGGFAGAPFTANASTFTTSVNVHF